MVLACSHLDHDPIALPPDHAEVLGPGARLFANDALVFRFERDLLGRDVEAADLCQEKQAVRRLGDEPVQRSNGAVPAEHQIDTRPNPLLTLRFRPWSWPSWAPARQ